MVVGYFFLIFIPIAFHNVLANRVSKMGTALLNG
jgi:hypothetical protein